MIPCFFCCLTGDVKDVVSCCTATSSAESLDTPRVALRCREAESTVGTVTDLPGSLPLYGDGRRSDVGPSRSGIGGTGGIGEGRVLNDGVTFTGLGIPDPFLGPGKSVVESRSFEAVTAARVLRFCLCTSTGEIVRAPSPALRGESCDEMDLDDEECAARYNEEELFGNLVVEPLALMSFMDGDLSIFFERTT